MIFHPPENHHPHHNLCLLACQHFGNLRLFQVTKPSLAIHRYFFDLLIGYWGMSLTITRMCAWGIWGVLPKSCVCNHGREACVYMCVCKSWERSTALQTWNWWSFLWLSLVLQFDQNYREKLTNFALIDWFCKRCKLFRAHTAFSNVFSRNHIISTPLNFRARWVLFNLCLVSSRLILIWKSFQK